SGVAAYSVLLASSRRSNTGRVSPHAVHGPMLLTYTPASVPASSVFAVSAAGDACPSSSTRRTATAGIRLLTNAPDQASFPGGPPRAGFQVRPTSSDCRTEPLPAAASRRVRPALIVLMDRRGPLTVAGANAPVPVARKIPAVPAATSTHVADANTDV